VYLNEPFVSGMLESKWFGSRRFTLKIVGLNFESASRSNQRLLFPALQSGVPCYLYRVPGGCPPEFGRFCDACMTSELTTSSASTQYNIYYSY
jgi:hypothetical protein